MVTSPFKFLVTSPLIRVDSFYKRYLKHPKHNPWTHFQNYTRMMIIPRIDTLTEILASASIKSLPIFSRYFKFTIKEEILLAGNMFFRLFFNSDDKNFTD